MNHYINQLKNYLYFALSAIFAVFVFSSCTKEVPKELLQQNKPQQNQTSQQNMPDDSIHRNLMSTEDKVTESGTESGDELAATLTKEADDADTKFEKTKSDADKKICIDKQMEAANYLMFQADLPPKKKYRPALKRYRRVLQLDPSNKEAAANKKQIEDIYQSMGMPVPD